MEDSETLAALRAAGDLRLMLPDLPAPPPPESDEVRLERIRDRVRRGSEWNARELTSAEALAGRRPGDEPARFNCISLPAWLVIAARAGVEAIPARQIATLDSVDYFASMDQLPDMGRTDQFCDQVVAGLGPDEVLRFEHQATGDLKSELSDGNAGEAGPPTRGIITGHDGREFPDIYDERFYEVLLDLGAERIRAYGRPYVRPEMAQGPQGDGRWPVEFRVFVVEGRVSGVANYYRQMDLDDQPALPEDKIRNAVDRSILQTEKMLTAMRELDLSIGNGGMQKQLERHGHPWPSKSFALDFLLAEDGRLLFLEGGPPGYYFSDPCAFLTENSDSITLEGVALSTKRPPVPFDEWRAGRFRMDPDPKPEEPSL